MSVLPPGTGPRPPVTSPEIQWRRVLLYSAVLFAETFAVGFVEGFITGYSRAAHGSAPPWIVWVFDVLMVAATIGVFAWIGRVQVTLTEGHAALVWVLGTVATFLLNVLLLGRSVGSFMCPTVTVTAFAVVGTVTGVATRSGRRAKLNPRA